MDEQKKQVCAVCGKDDGFGYANSTLTLTAGYGSKNDLESITIHICGECCDKAFEKIAKLPLAERTEYSPL